jgi:hypothetical protein
MLNVAVICVALTTTRLPTVMPGLATATVAPEIKLLPVRVTCAFDPWTPLAGLIEVSTGGGGGLTVKVRAELVPPLVVTVTFAGPNAAFAAIVKDAVICVKLTTVTLLIEIPGLLVETLDPLTKL